tara:strand:+ start:305 stop:523 length:219 start_codon:yes stop_codon:yes gene_type:complete
MVQEKNIWKFNDDEWKVHIDKKEICDKLDMKFKLKASTVYYETGVLSKETSWDVIVPNKLIAKVKKLLKETT